MLTNSKLQTIVLTARISEAERFYSDVLALSLIGRSHGALRYDVSGSELRVSPVPATVPTNHTVLGFAVPNVEGVCAHLNKLGITMERFAGFPHDANGILSTHEGARVAWFRDPDGNLLSIVQYAAEGAE